MEKQVKKATSAEDLTPHKQTFLEKEVSSSWNKEDESEMDDEASALATKLSHQGR